MVSTSGREIARRSGASDLDVASHRALQQLRDLHMLPGAVMQLDVTAPAISSGQKLLKLLSSKFFRVATLEVSANFDGMEHLTSDLGTAAGFTEDVAASEFAKAHGIVTGGEVDAVACLQCLSAAKNANPQIVNTDLPPAVQHKYWSVLYKYAHLLALTLADLATPAAVEPMQIQTFG